MVRSLVVDASVMVKWLRSEREALLEQADLLLFHAEAISTPLICHPD